MESWTTRNTKGDVEYPFGENAEGNVIYTRGGWVSIHVAADQRPNLPIDILGPIGTEADRISAYTTYVAYSGHYHVNEDVIIHKVTTSLYPNWVGIELQRSFELSGNNLVLRMPPREIGEEIFINELCWIREE